MAKIMRTSKRRTFEVTDFEYGGTRFRSSTLQLGTVDLDESLCVEVVTEEMANSVLKFEDSLVGLSLSSVYIRIFNQVWIGYILEGQ